MRALLYLLWLSSLPALAQGPDDASSDAGEATAAEEVESFKSTQRRFGERMTELQDDTRSFVEHREQEERARLSEGYDEAVAVLDTLEASHRKLAIDEMELFLERYPSAEYSSHVRFRLADLYFEESKDQWLVETKAYGLLEDEYGDERYDELPDPPRIDLARSIALYQRIIADNAGLSREEQYDPLDAVYYVLGFSYREANSKQHDDALARAAFQDLIAVRPDSELADVAHLFLGNYHFDDNDFPAAIAEYRIVFDRGPQGSYFPESVYQLAWAYYKLAGPEVTRDSMGPEAYDLSLELFTLLLDASEELEDATGSKSDYEPDAVKYIAISFFDLSELEEESPVGVASRYFQQIGGRDWEPEVYFALAEVLESQGAWDDAIAVYTLLQDDPRWIDNPDNPEYQMRVVRLHASKRPPDLAASAAARVLLTDRYNTESTWYAANANNPDALATSRKYIEASLADVAIEYRLKANQTGAREDYLLAAARFRDYLAKFPIADDYFEQQWYLADTLYRAQEHVDALVEYEQLIKSAPHHPYGDGSVYFAMDSSRQLVEQRQAPPTLAEAFMAQDLLAIAKEQGASLWMVPAANAVERTYEVPSGDPVAVYALTSDHQRFLDTSARLLAWDFQTPESAELIDFKQVVDDRRHQVAYLGAQLLWFHNRYDEARPQLEAIIDTWPQTDEAAYAAGLMVDSFQREGDLAKLREYTHKYMAMSLGADAAMAQDRQARFATLLEGAAFKEALAFVDAGERERAADAFLAFLEQFPESEFAPAALFNAANNYEIVGQSERASALFEDYVRRYPDDERSKSLYYRIAGNYEATFQLDKAISFYEEVVRRFPRDPDTADAAYNAAFLRIGLGDHRGAARGFEAYAKTYRDAADRESVAFRAGEQWDLVSATEGRKFYQRYLEEYGLTNPDHAIEAKYRLALLYLDSGSRRRYDTYLEQIRRDFDTLAAQGATLGWASRHYAAEAAFVPFKAAFDDFVDDELTRNEARDAKLLQETKPMELKALETQGLSIVATYGDFEYSTAALQMIAAAYLDYADLGFALTPPAGLSPEEEDAYWELLETQVFPAFYAAQEKAVTRFQKVIEISREQKQYSVWVGKASDALNALDPRTYPKEKPEIRGQAEARQPPALTPVPMPVPEQGAP